MVRSDARADGRDDRAGDRDDTTDHRDDLSRDRDSAAQQRDTDAEHRLATARTRTDDLAERLHRTSLQILARLARLEHTTLDTDHLDLPPTALARLEELLAEQRTLARRDHQAASYERRAAGRDRHHSPGDRTDSGQDRHDARADRHQAAIDREQVDPRDLPTPPGADTSPTAPQPPDPTGSRQDLAIATSRQRIAETRSYLSALGRDRTAPPAPGSAPDPPEPDA